MNRLCDKKYLTSAVLMGWRLFNRDTFGAIFPNAVMMFTSSRSYDKLQYHIAVIGTVFDAMRFLQTSCLSTPDAMRLRHDKINPKSQISKIDKYSIQQINSMIKNTY